MIRVETVDAPAWFAVVIITGDRIRCIGFKRKRDRDGWLGWFAASLGALADAVPTSRI